MRHYLYEPDESWIARRFAFHRKGLDDVRRTIETSARAKGKVAYFDTAVSAAWEAIRHGWALEEPLETLHGWLDEAVGWCEEALDAGRDPGPSVTARWLSMATIAGPSGRGAAARLAELLADAPAEETDVDPLTRDLGLALAALASGDLAAARRAGQGMSRAEADPAVPPPVLDVHGGLDRVVLAVVDRDAMALASALAKRSAANASRYGESIEAKRHGEGLVDLHGTSLAARARAAGVPVDAPAADIALGLLRPAPT